MHILRCGKRLILLLAMSSQVIIGIPNSIAGESSLDLEALEAINSATALFYEHAGRLATNQSNDKDEDLLHEAEIALQRARSRYDNENYKGAIHHATKVKEILN